MLQPSKNAIVFSNLNWNQQIAMRLQPSESGQPGWFGYPIKLAGYDFRCDTRPIFSLVHALTHGQQCVLLCFNPSLVYFLLFLLPLPVRRISLFQWRPLGRISRAKRLVVWLSLWRSHEIVVYSHLSARYLQRLFPGKPIQQIGLFADEKYFLPPQSDGELSLPFIFVPGDHKREERLLGYIADKLDLDVVRVTRNEHIRKTVEALAHPRVDLRYDVSFEELRTLYQTCRAVLILSDASEIPTGITSLAEALSCGSDVVISRGHSNSWPSEITKAFPFATVAPGADADAVARALRLQWNTGKKWERRQRARQFALRHLSAEALAQNWRDILEEAALARTE